MQQIPVILVGRDYWLRVVDFQFLADEGVIKDEHLQLISFAQSSEEEWKIIAGIHRIET
jgi:predicted Rossmann-fold nucleotide-binding protein